MSLKTYALGLLAGLLGTVITAIPALAETPTVSSIGKKLICQCGCTLILVNCNHQECGSREQMNTQIASMIAGGQTEAQIVQSFVDRYGPQVLSAPTKSGFNLTAWVLPFAVLAAGGAILYFLIQNWVQRGKTMPEDIPPSLAQERAKYSGRIARDLERFER